MRTTITIQNLKCDGCKHTLQTKVSKILGISNVLVDVAESSISFDYDAPSVLEKLKTELSALGYPIIGDSNTVFSKAKSYVSCAVGKMTSKKNPEEL